MIKKYPSKRPNGSAYAAVLSGAFGIACLGLFSILAELSTPLRGTLALVGSVGVLSGKTILPLLIWIILWIVLDIFWRKKDLDDQKTIFWARIFLLIGLLGTFPLFYRLFAIL